MQSLLHPIYKLEPTAVKILQILACYHTGLSDTEFNRKLAACRVDTQKASEEVITLQKKKLVAVTKKGRKLRVFATYSGVTLLASASSGTIDANDPKTYPPAELPLLLTYGYGNNGELATGVVTFTTGSYCEEEQEFYPEVHCANGFYDYTGMSLNGLYWTLCPPDLDTEFSHWQKDTKHEQHTD